MHYRVLFVIGTLLLLISLVVNVTADLVVKGSGGKAEHVTAATATSVHGRPDRTPETAG